MKPGLIKYTIVYNIGESVQRYQYVYSREAALDYVKELERHEKNHHIRVFKASHVEVMLRMGKKKK